MVARGNANHLLRSKLDPHQLSTGSCFLLKAGRCPPISLEMIQLEPSVQIVGRIAKQIETINALFLKAFSAPVVDPKWCNMTPTRSTCPCVLFFSFCYIYIKRLQFCTEDPHLLKKNPPYYFGTCDKYRQFHSVPKNTAHIFFWNPMTSSRQPHLTFKWRLTWWVAFGHGAVM